MKCTHISSPKPKPIWPRALDPVDTIWKITPPQSAPWQMEYAVFAERLWGALDKHGVILPKGMALMAKGEFGRN
jgi:hypothetical protein